MDAGEEGEGALHILCLFLSLLLCTKQSALHYSCLSREAVDYIEKVNKPLLVKILNTTHSIL